MNKSWEIKIKKQEALIKKVLNNFIALDVYDSLLKKSSISYVSLSNDFSTLKIYISVYQKEKFDKIINRYKTNKGLFKSLLAKKINFKKVPELVFLEDKTQQRVAEIEQIFERIKEEKNGR